MQMLCKHLPSRICLHKHASTQIHCRKLGNGAEHNFRNVFKYPVGKSITIFHIHTIFVTKTETEQRGSLRDEKNKLNMKT